MLPRFSPLPLPLSLACSILAGCAATNNYDNGQNPFNEPVSRQATAQAQLTPALPEHYVAKPQEAAQEAAGALPDDRVAIAIPAGQERQIEAIQDPSGASAHVQEMLDEASRLGALGDVEGKAALLSQAGYSGSPSAFYDLARMYLDGSLPNDMAQALHYITLAHDAGYAEATRVLGMLYLRGQGVPADEHYGRLLLEQASKSSARAAREYGLLLANQSPPHLNDSELGMQYLRDAAERGDRDAAQALARELARAGLNAEAEQISTATSVAPHAAPTLSPGDELKARAMRGDTGAMFSYAQKVMLGGIPSSEPEFTAYCWLAAAEKLGSREAEKELVFIRGVRAISDSKSPGRLDQCISDLHYQVSGQK